MFYVCFFITVFNAHGPGAAGAGVHVLARWCAHAPYRRGRAYVVHCDPNETL